MMLFDCKPISHSCDVIRDRSRTFIAIARLELWGEELWLLEERLEQIANDSFGLTAHARHAKVLIEVLSQESLEFMLLVAHFGTKRDERR